MSRNRKPLTVEQRERKCAKDRERRLKIKAAKVERLSKPELFRVAPQPRAKPPQGIFARLLAMFGIQLL